MKEKTKNIIIVIALIILIVILLIILFAPELTNMLNSAIDEEKLPAARSEANRILAGIENYCATSKMNAALDEEYIDICADGVTTDEVPEMTSLYDDIKLEKVTYDGDKVTELVLEVYDIRLELVDEEFEVIEN